MRSVSSFAFRRLPRCFPRDLLDDTRVVVLPSVRLFACVPYVGITLGRFYLLAPSVARDEGVHAHELVHVVQWRTLGTVGFLWRYLRLFLRHGYAANPLERTAYRIESLVRADAVPFDAVDLTIADL